MSRKFETQISEFEEGEITDESHTQSPPHSKKNWSARFQFQEKGEDEIVLQRNALLSNNLFSRSSVHKHSRRRNSCSRELQKWIKQEISQNRSKRQFELTSLKSRNFALPIASSCSSISPRGTVTGVQSIECKKEKKIPAAASNYSAKAKLSSTTMKQDVSTMFPSESKLTKVIKPGSNISDLSIEELLNVHKYLLEQLKNLDLNDSECNPVCSGDTHNDIVTSGIGKCDGSLQPNLDLDINDADSKPIENVKNLRDDAKLEECKSQAQESCFKVNKSCPNQPDKLIGNTIPNEESMPSISACSASIFSNKVDMKGETYDKGFSQISPIDSKSISVKPSTIINEQNSLKDQFSTSMSIKEETPSLQGQQKLPIQNVQTGTKPKSSKRSEKKKKNKPLPSAGKVSPVPRENFSKSSKEIEPDVHPQVTGNSKNLKTKKEEPLEIPPSSIRAKVSNYLENLPMESKDNTNRGYNRILKKLLSMEDKLVSQNKSILEFKRLSDEKKIVLDKSQAKVYQAQIDAAVENREAMIKKMREAFQNVKMDLEKLDDLK